MTDSLTQLERSVLEKLLDGDHPLLGQLRQQLVSCAATERELTGCGFFTTFLVHPSFKTLPDLTFTFGDVDAKIAGLTFGAGFLLYVTDGRLDVLEGYCYGELWPDSIESFALHYASGGSRNLAALGSR